MLPAAILPECVAAWHRGAFAIAALGWELPHSSSVPPVTWLALPAVVVSLAAILAVQGRSLAALAAALGAAAFVHPWLPLALLPLAAAAGTDGHRRTLAVAGGILVIGVGAAALITPACEPGAAVAGQRLAAAVAAWSYASRAAGLPLAILAALDLSWGPRTHRRQGAAALVVVAAAGLGVSGVIDGATALGTMLAMVAWRAAAGARLMIGWQRTWPAQAGASALVLIVPVLAFARIGVSERTATGFSTSATWQALDELPRPSSVVVTGGPADLAAVLWRGGRADGNALRLVDVPDAPPGELAPPLYVWPETAAALRVRGFTLGPHGALRARRLHRVVDASPCVVLTTSWVPVALQAASGRLAGHFPDVAPLRGVLLYLASDSPLRPAPAGWPAGSEGGYSDQSFDREQADEAVALAEAAARDEFDLGHAGDHRFVYRVRFDRLQNAASVLEVALGGPPRAAWSRHYSAQELPPRLRPRLCASTTDRIAVAREGGPSSTAVDRLAP